MVVRKYWLPLTLTALAVVLNLAAFKAQETRDEMVARSTEQYLAVATKTFEDTTKYFRDMVQRLRAGSEPPVSLESIMHVQAEALAAQARALEQLQQVRKRDWTDWLQFASTITAMLGVVSTAILS
jgi:hypothetical protein